MGNTGRCHMRTLVSANRSSEAVFVARPAFSYPLYLYTRISHRLALISAMTSTDRDALVALFSATGGANWTNNKNWNTAADLSAWHGVTVNSQGHVQKLRLRKNNLVGVFAVRLLHKRSIFSNNSLTLSFPPFHQLKILPHKLIALVCFAPKCDRTHSFEWCRIHFRIEPANFASSQIMSSTPSCPSSRRM